jgi:hypothetical protein
MRSAFLALKYRRKSSRSRASNSARSWSGGRTRSLRLPSRGAVKVVSISTELSVVMVSQNKGSDSTKYMRNRPFYPQNPPTLAALWTGPVDKTEQPVYPRPARFWVINTLSPAGPGRRTRPRRRPSTGASAPRCVSDERRRQRRHRPTDWFRPQSRRRMTPISLPWIRTSL